jgi:hypothetical protein
MTSERQGEHPARAFGTTGGGFAEGECDDTALDEQVGSFATGEEKPEEFPQDEKLGSFARGQEDTDNPQNVAEGTFETGADGESRADEESGANKES